MSDNGNEYRYYGINKENDRDTLKVPQIIF